MLPCAAFAGPPEPAFSFSAFLLPAHSLLRGGADFLSSHLAAAPGFVHNWLTRLQQGVFGASLVSFPYPALKTAHRVAQVRVWIFSPKRVYPPPKGGGAGYRLFSSSEFSRGEARCFSAGKEGRFVSEGFSGSCLWQLLATTGSHGFNRAGVGLRWCRSLTRPPKPHTGPHRGEFGFCLLAGASQEDHPPFRQSRIRTQAEEKNTSALLFKNRTS